MSLITPDFGLLFWMTIVFAIVFFILAKFGFPVITGMVEERSKRIEQSIAKAEEAEQKLAGLAEQNRQMIEQARAEQARILAEAAQSRETMLRDARGQAQDEASRILADARLQIAAEKESALRDIRKEVAMLSVSIAEKIMRKDLQSDLSQQELIQRLVDEAADKKHS